MDDLKEINNENENGNQQNAVEQNISEFNNNDNNINEDPNKNNNNFIKSIKIHGNEIYNSYNIMNFGNNSFSRNNINFIKIEMSENRQLKLNNNRIDLIPRKKEYLGKIDKNDKDIIKKKLSELYRNSESLVKLYTLEEGKFYKKLNLWLFTLNINLYRRIAPICGKIMNNLYLQMKNQRKFNKTLYRGLTVTKADIFLYKACEGDIFFYPAFTSSSSDKKIIKTFQEINANFEFKNLAEKCICSIQINHYSEDSDVSQAAIIIKISDLNESEFLFPPFSFFKIKKVLFNSSNNILGKDLKENKIYDGTLEHPFFIELDIIKRDFYLDNAFANEKKFCVEYNKKNNRWINPKNKYKNTINYIGIKHK